MTTKSCTGCGVTIQDWVAERTGGLCMPCLSGPIKCIDCAKPMVRQFGRKDEDHICISCSRKRSVSTEEVEFNGVWMAVGWPEEIIAAQNIDKVSISGKDFPRVRYGSEKNVDQDFSLPCGDCAVIKGQFHVPDCDVEQCPKCFGQLLSCSCTDG